jgi:hypothetical protein
MAEVPVTPEIADFIANTLRATRAGTLKWESAGPKQLSANLDDNYRVEVREVPDLDGQTNDPDHVLTLFVGDRKLFTIDRRDVSGEELQAALGEAVEYSYPIFTELWRRAQIIALHLSDHLAKVNSVLQRGLDKGLK